MFTGLEAASTSTAQGKGERGAAGEAGKESGSGSPRFLLLSTVKPLAEAVTVGDKLQSRTSNTLNQLVRTHHKHRDTFHTVI